MRVLITLVTAEILCDLLWENWPYCIFKNQQHGICAL